MNWLVLLLVIAALAGLWVVDRKVRRLNMLAWLAAWFAALYVFFSYGIEPPLPTSIVFMYLGIVVIILTAYLSATSAYLAEARDAVVAFTTEKRYAIPLVIVLVLLPLLVAANVYLNITQEPAAPISGRTIHPPPPAQIQFKGKTINLATAANPYRVLEERDPAAFAEHVENGRRVYFQNCAFCHGDNMEGDGHFAHGFDPIPANFSDPQTIGILQESYIFWRVAKGGPGLPHESTPWSSAMPAWEHFLTEEEIWDVTLFLYAFTGHRPRALHAAEDSALE